MAALERNVRLVENGARPKLPNMGLVKTGCGVGIDALGSPMAADMGKPPFRTISGFTPKKAGFHNTRSANLPTSIEPTSCPIPCAMAGLIVYFDRYRRTRKLSFALDIFSAAVCDRCPRCTFILCAVCQVRMMTS